MSAEINVRSNDKKNSKVPLVIESDVIYPTSSSGSDMYDGSGFEQAYLEKSKIISRAIDEIGFGKYDRTVVFLNRSQPFYVKFV